MTDNAKPLHPAVQAALDMLSEPLRRRAEDEILNGRDDQGNALVPHIQSGLLAQADYTSLERRVMARFGQSYDAGPMPVRQEVYLGTAQPDWALTDVEIALLAAQGFTIPPRNEWKLDEPHLGFQGDLRQALKKVRIGRFYDAGPMKLGQMVHQGTVTGRISMSRPEEARMPRRDPKTDALD